MHIPGYQIERELGQGGMAIVYLAMQESLHRHVALKVIKPTLITDEEFAHRFLREGRIIAQLNHPHILPVYDIGSHDNIYYLSMEYLPGDTLQHSIGSGLPLLESLTIIRAIASALDYAHHRNIIHRDIKPQNILFRENGNPVLTDFGIAKTLGGATIMTRTGLSIGTPRYMSPEQIRGQAVDARSDLYSLGVLFYQMLTRNVPYAAEDSFALAMMHVTAPIPDLPPRLARFQPFLTRLLEKDPNQRFQNGQEIIAALDALEASSGSGNTQKTLIVSAGPTASNQRRGWKTALPLAAALAGVAAGGYLWINRPAPPTPPITTSLADRPKESPAVDSTAQRRAEVDQLLAQAIQQQQTGALSDSLARIEQGLHLVPDHPALLALREQIKRQMTEAEQTRAHREQQQQIERQADQIFEQARRSQQRGALDISVIQIEQGLQLMSDHPALLALKRDVLAQRAKREREAELMQRQAETAEQQRIESERRKAEIEQQKIESEQRKAEIEQQKIENERQRAEADLRRRRKADEFLERALDYQKDRAYEVSLLQIEQGLQQIPDHARLLALRDEVRRQFRAAKTESAPEVKPAPEEDTTQIAALLNKCEAHLRANRLTSGRRGNAADCYAEVLKLDSSNSQALAGLEQISDHYADLAITNLQQGNPKASRNALDKLGQLKPSHPRLSELREQLAEAEAAAKPTPPPPAEKPAAPTPVATVVPPSASSANLPKTEIAPIDFISLPRATGQSPAAAQPPATGKAPTTDSKPAATTPPRAMDSSTPGASQDTRLSKIEPDKKSSPRQTTSPPAPPDEEPAQPKAESPEETPSAAQAWAAIKDSNDPAAIERFLVTYPKGRQAAAARLTLKQLRRQQAALPARLAIEADVEDAQVTINGRHVGTAPLEVELKPGPYKIRVIREGYQDWNERVDLAANGNRLLSATLSARPATVAASPASASDQTPKSVQEPKATETKAEKPVTNQPTSPPPQAQMAKAGQGLGCVRGNCRTGEGAYRHPNGSEYIGEFRNAKMHGQGTYLYAGRDEKYVGEWRDGVIDGAGTYYYGSGNRYEGQWRDGHKSGQGTYLYANGEKYVGEFQDDQPSGQGIYYYKNGDRYEGQWRDGHKHGQGILYENGKKLVGEWDTDRKVRITVQQ
ncbi:MAG: protein kinase [Candidatus Competibacteraceae bacterium]|nr:protein kinase [Candidatus Competibacteraceae bacterium]